MHILVVIGYLVLAALAGLLLGFVVPARRSRRLERKARELGFQFYARATPFQNTEVQGLTILKGGSSTPVENLLERVNGSCYFLIGDIREVWEESIPLVTTVAAFRVAARHLPVFQIEERNAIERVIEHIERAFGKKLSEFGPDHEFGHNFFVHCSDKGAVETFLTPAKLAYLRDHAAHYHIESSPDWLLIYRPGYEVQAENLKDFAEITSAMASVLLSIQNLKSPTAA